MQLKKYILVLLTCLTITGCTINTPVNDPNTDLDNVPDNNLSTNLDNISNDVAKFREEYAALNSSIEVIIPDNAFIHYGTSKEVLDILTDGTGIIYFGRPTCPWCRNIIPILASTAMENDMVIYYYNPGDVSTEEIDLYVEIKNEISDHLRVDNNGDPVLYLPDVYFVKNGEVIGHKLGSASTQEDPYTPLTSTEVQELINIYSNYMKELKN